MDNEYVNKEAVTEKVKTKKKTKKSRSGRSSGRAFTQILNGEFLTKEFMLNNLTYIFFVIFMLLLVVAKGYYGKQLSKDVDTKQKELNELTADYVEAKARLEEETRRVVLVEELSPKGLKETVNPTKVIRLKKEDE